MKFFYQYTLIFLLILLSCFFSFLYSEFEKTLSEDIGTGVDILSVEPVIETTTGSIQENTTSTTGTTSLILEQEITGNIQPQSLPFPLTQIQEIYPRDTTGRGEYILLSFYGTYSGVVRVVGLGTSTSEKSFSLQTITGAQFIITDTPNKLIPQGNQQIITISSITLTDDGEYLEVILSDGITHDKVQYTGSITDKSNIFRGTTDGAGRRLFTLFQLPSVLSSLSPPQPSPPPDQAITGGVFTGSEPIITGGITTGVVLTGVISSGINTTTGVDIGINTGDLVTSGVNTTGNIEPLPIPSIPISPPQQNLPFISEIYPRDEKFAEYIELYFPSSRKGEISIEGLGQGDASKSFLVDQSSHSYLVVTDDTTKFSPNTPLLSLPSISLTNEGENLILRDAAGHEIDKAVYQGPKEQYSELFDSSISLQSGTRVFTISQLPTPGFDRNMSAHLLPEKQPPPRCGIDLQNTSPVYSTNKLNFQAVLESNFLSNNSPYTCERLFPGADTPYYTGCNPSYVSYPHAGIYLLQLRIGGPTPLCEITQEINLPDEKKQPTTTPSGGSYYEELYRKRKERYETLTKAVRSLGIHPTTSGEITESIDGLLEDKPIPTQLLETGPNIAIKIRIHSILANPAGKDTESERLVVENISDETLNTNTLQILRGTTSKKLPPDILLPPHALVSIIGDLGLTNKPTCIHLRDIATQALLSSFCYPQPKEGVVFTGGVAELRSAPEEEFFTHLSLQVTDTGSCVVYGEQVVVCKEFPFGFSEAKERKKQTKKQMSMEKKIAELQRKYDLRREKYADSSAKHKITVASYIKRNRELRNDLSVAKKEQQMFKGFYFLLKKELIGVGQPVWGNNLFAQIDALYNRLRLQDPTHPVVYGPVQMSPGDVDLRYNFLINGKLPEDKINTPVLTSYLSDQKESYTHLLVNLLLFE